MSETINWSYSHLKTLRQCHRQYYFSFIAANHHKKNLMRRTAFELKNMKNIDMWKGSIIDYVMEKIIVPSIGEKLDFDSIADEAVNIAKKQFKFSEKKHYKEHTKGNTDEHFAILDIHEIRKKYSENEINNVYDTVKKIILGIPEINFDNGINLIEYLKKASWKKANINNYFFEFENIKVKPQIDALFYIDEKPVVIDWKAGRSEYSDYKLQLMMCGTAIFKNNNEKEDKKKYKHTDITLLEINLLKKKIYNHPFNNTSIAEMTDYIYRNKTDIELLHKNFNDADIDDYGITDNEGTCAICKYRTLCNYILENKNFKEDEYIKFIQDYATKQ